jgi:hypothetical protein
VARALYGGLTICDDSVPARLGLALMMVAFVDVEQDHPSDADARVHEALSLYREQNNTWGFARALYLLGRSAQQRGDHASARGWLLESLGLQRRLDDRQGLTQSLLALADTALDQGDSEASNQSLPKRWHCARSRRSARGGPLSRRHGVGAPPADSRLVRMAAAARSCATLPAIATRERQRVQDVLGRRGEL